MSNRSANNGKVGAALVVGGGIGGMQAALDLANAGIKVYLVEKRSSIGGKMSQLDKTFPTNDCAMCTMAPRLVEIGRNPDVVLFTYSEVRQVSGENGNFKVTIKKYPRYVDEDLCTGCGACVANCPVWNVVQLAEKTPVTLTPSIKNEVDEVLKKHQDREGPLLPILQDIQKKFNYLPKDVLFYIAQQTGYSLSHIYRIATFYSAFSITPRGKHVINVCMGTTCYVRGSERIMEKFSSELGIRPGETTPDMQFTLKSLRCLGCCSLAPAAIIGDAVYGKLTIKDVPKVVRKYQRM